MTFTEIIKLILKDLSFINYESKACIFVWIKALKELAERY
jgi:hypothetical protein